MRVVPLFVRRSRRCVFCKRKRGARVYPRVGCGWTGADTRESRALRAPFNNLSRTPLPRARRADYIGDSRVTGRAAHALRRLLCPLPLWPTR
jgi:hypothetical protein